MAILWFQVPAVVALELVGRFSPGPDAGGPLPWALVHLGFVLVATAAAIAAWRLAEDSRAHADHAYQRLQESEQRFRFHFEHASVGMCVTHPDGRFMGVNPAYCRITGYSEEELLGLNFQAITHPDDLDHNLEQLRALLRGQVDAFDVEKRYVRPDGGVVHVLNTVAAMPDAEGAPRFVIATAQDVSERKQAEAALVRQAFHDVLTGLPNRALLVERLREVLERSRLTSARTAVLFLDLDRLKWVNDSFGHAGGDQVLLTVARRLADSVREGETVARIGGDEFVAVCEDVGDEGVAVAVGRRLGAAIARPVEVDGHTFALTASVGVVVSPLDAPCTPESLLHEADTAMYRAKERGRDRVELYDQDVECQDSTRLETAAALRLALHRGELRVHYQPFVELGAGRPAGVEALVRWEHPQLGLVSPAEFVSVAEETGLILPLGRFVLGEACRQVASWNRAATAGRQLSVAVNLSARQLASPDLAEDVRSILEATGLDPSLLCLEITESVLMDDAGASRTVLEQLKAVGVTLAVDDFGTGYSSLLYLRRFPVDLLKVDRSFVTGMLDSPEDGAIVSAVVGLARALGLSSVAEGVETPEQASHLRALGCELAQGFHWSRPLPPEEVVGWMDQAWSAREEIPTPITVLVVDDDVALRRTLRLALQAEGFVVVAEAGDGADGIALARAHQPDLVLLDLAMPRMGGLEALPRILDAAPGAKVAVLTALDQAATGGRDVPAAGWLDKSDLGRTLERLSELVGAAR